jgi:putative ABC transport system permease protein
LPPILWKRVEKHLRRWLPPRSADAAIGDLLEKYEHRRRAIGRWAAAWWLLREAGSISRAYRAAPPPAGSPRALSACVAGLLSATATDLRIALRTLARQPLVTAAVVLPVALAIATNTALFSLIDGLLFRELRLVRDPGSLIQIDFDPQAYIRRQDIEGARDRLLAAAWISNAIHTGSRVIFDDDIAWSGTELAERAVSPNFFEALGVFPALGRGFLPHDLDAGGPPPVVLGHDLWRVHFGAAPTVLDGPVDLAGVRVRVVGIAPQAFDFPRGTNVWSLLDVRGDVARTRLPTYARVADGMSMASARGLAAYPLRIRPLPEAVRPDGALAVAFLFGATALLLLVSWLQVGALLFARAAGRSTEIGVRLALGAGRLRLLRGLAMEGAAVAAFALALGWLATPSFVAAVVAILPAPLTSGQQVEPDVRTLLFACLTAGVGLLLLTLLPVELLRRANPQQLLRGVVSGAGTATRAAPVRSAILLMQVSLTVVLLYVAGLVAHSFARITTFDLGFDPNGVLVWRVPRLLEERAPIPQGMDARAALREAIVASQARQVNQFERVVSALDALRASPEIAGAAASRYHPVIRAQSRSPLTLPDLPDAAPIHARTNHVTPEFFDTLRMRVIEGDTFASGSLRRVFDVVVINETFARRLRAYGPVIGQRIMLSGTSASRIVGVIADYVDQAPDQAPDPQVFLPTPPQRTASLWMGIVRTRGDLAAAQARIRSIVEDTWGAGTETTFTRMEDEIARATAEWRARTVFLTLLAALCLPLALAGLLGALSYDTRSRAHEMAVRLALGADPGHVRRRVIARALGLVAAGLAAGLAGGWVVGRLMDSYLFGVRAADPATMAGVGGLLLACAWLAALGPAWRASRVDPALLLKEI